MAAHSLAPEDADRNWEDFQATLSRSSAPVRVSLRHQKGFDGNCVGLLRCGQHGEERADLSCSLGRVAGGADDGDVAGAGVGDEQQIAGAGESQCVGTVADLDCIDPQAVVDRVDADRIRAEVADPQCGVVRADNSARGMSTDQRSASDFIGAGGDFGDGVAVEVGDEYLAAVGLHGEIHGRLAYVEKVKKVVRLFRIGGRSFSGQGKHHYLMAAGAGDESLRRVGQDDRVSGSRTVGEDAADFQSMAIDEGHAATHAVGDQQGFIVGRDARHARRFADADDGDLSATIEI